MLKRIVLTLTLLILMSNSVSAIGFVECEVEDHGDYWLVVGDCYQGRHALIFKGDSPHTLIYKFGKTDSLDKVYDHTIIRFNSNIYGKGCPPFDEDYIIWWVGDIDDVKIYRPVYPSCSHYDTISFLRSSPDSYPKVYKNVELVSGIVPQYFGAVKPLPTAVENPDYSEMPYIYLLEEDDWHFAGVYQDSAFYEDDNYWYVMGTYGSVGIYAPEYLNDKSRVLTLYAATFDDSSEKQITIEYSSDGKNWIRVPSVVHKEITELVIPSDALYIVIVAPKGVAIYKEVYLTASSIPRTTVTTTTTKKCILPPDPYPEPEIRVPLIGLISPVELTIFLTISIASLIPIAKASGIAWVLIKKGIQSVRKFIRKKLSRYKY